MGCKSLIRRGMAAFEIMFAFRKRLWHDLDMDAKTTHSKVERYEDRKQAMLLISRIELEAWFDAGMKRYPGQAKIKRIVDYLCRTVAE